MSKGKMLYLSAHSILEYEEVSLFTQMGWEVFSLGSYINPNTPHDPKRPSIKSDANEYLLNVALQSSKENLHEKLIEWADVIYVMHKPEWVTNNWEKIQAKKVIWRAIGQSTPLVESQLFIPRLQGLKIVRYSPEEKYIKDYVGEDAVIRFYKDPEEFCGYSGEINGVLNVTQSMKERGRFCGYEIFKEATEGFDRFLFGTPSRNPDLTQMDDPLWKGELSYTSLKEAYRRYRVYFYTGTYPASYTLNFIEAMMTGIPIVAIGRQLADQRFFDMNAYEVDKIIENGVNGFVSDSIETLREDIGYLLSNPDKAKEMGEKGRQTAIELFGKETIKKQWEDFFKTL